MCAAFTLLADGRADGGDAPDGRASGDAAYVLVRGQSCPNPHCPDQYGVDAPDDCRCGVLRALKHFCYRRERAKRWGFYYPSGSPECHPTWGHFQTCWRPFPGATQCPVCYPQLGVGAATLDLGPAPPHTPYVESPQEYFQPPQEYAPMPEPQAPINEQAPINDPIVPMSVNDPLLRPYNADEALMPPPLSFSSDSPLLPYSDDASIFEQPLGMLGQ
jgi:hypothetical protein